jgi:ribosome maturation protein Sdo1
MISLDDAVIARYSKGDLSFEILVDPEKARAF